MEQTATRLELPSTTYHALEQIARREGLTPLRMIETWMRQYERGEQLLALRQEYQQLTDEALLRTITHAEEKRMDALCRHIEVLSPPFHSASGREQRDREAEALIAKSEKLLDLAAQQSPR